MRLWLIGSAIGESPSPAMHNAALVARGIEGGYGLRDVTAAELPATLAQMRTDGVRGANVTIPHKLAAAALCDALEGDAATLGAVNTVTVEGGRLVGGNTDARGFERALREEGLWPAAAGEAVVLGAGGAAAGVALALSRSPLTRITVVARHPQAGCRWAERLTAAAPVALGAVGWTEEEARRAAARAALVVNATPADLAAMPFDVAGLAPGCTVVDLRYRPRPVDLVAAARSAGRRATDGVEMLLQQGMLSFTRWTGREPPWEVARAALRAAVGE